jgi:uncharacterized membrane protein YbhN (UPF0104 family)
LLLAAAGAGGIALTVWSLRAGGVSKGALADGMVCYEILTYGVYAIALAVAGFGLWFGVFPGPHPLGLTLIPATVSTAVILAVLSMLYVYEPVERFLRRRAEGSAGRAADRWKRATTLPRTIHTGLLAALGMVRRRDPSVLGAVAYWGFDIGAPWATFRAFGHVPPAAVLVSGYYIGSLGSALPLPGGIGGRGRRHDRRLPRLWRRGSACHDRRPRVPHDLLLATDGPGRHRILPPATRARSRYEGMSCTQAT